MLYRQLVLLWETASWVDIERLMALGKLPILKDFCSKGSAGRLASVAPLSQVSGAISLANGTAPCDHQVFSNLKLNDKANCALESCASDWQPIWETLAHSGDRGIAINWPITHPAHSQQTQIISDRYCLQGRHHYRYCTPRESISETINDSLRSTLNASRILPEELGTDVLSEFLEIDRSLLAQQKDLHQVRQIIARIYSVHAASLVMLENESWDNCFIAYPALQEILYLIEKSSLQPKHRDKIYTILDQLLGVILSLTDSNTMVHIISSHSYISNQPKLAHGTGVWAIRGGNIINNRVIQGAHVLDFAPTLIRLRGQSSDRFTHQPRTDLFSSLPVSNKEQALKTEQEPRLTPKQALWSHLLEDGRIPRLLLPQKKFDRTLIKQIHSDALESEFESLLEQQRYADASIVGNEMNHLFPNKPKTQINYAYCLLAEKKYSELEEHIAANNVDASELLKIEFSIISARIHLAKGDLQPAKRTISELSTTPLTTPTQQLKIAGIYRDLGETTPAISIYKTHIKRYPGHIQPHILLAVVLLKDKQYLLAEQTALTALKIDSTNERAQYTVAMARLRQGKKAVAIKGLENYCQITGGTRLINRVLKFAQ
ncbi:MAG: alkaline phosphatase family protein [Akkermansiaceae bacterium]